MIRRLASLGAGAGAGFLLAMSPVAIAEEPRLSLYDEPSGAAPRPGTVAPAPKAVSTAVSEFKKQIDDKLGAVELKVEGSAYYKYDEALADTVAAVRHSLASYAEYIGNFGRTVQNSVIKDERSILKAVSSLKADDEQFLPSAIYVLIAGLTGSIVARPRSVVSRIALPWVFGLGAFAYTMPHTASNTLRAIWKLEKEQTPKLAEAQSNLSANLGAKVQDLTDQAKATIISGENTVQESVKETRKSVSDWLERK